MGGTMLAEADTIWTGLSGLFILAIIAWLVLRAIRGRRG